MDMLELIKSRRSVKDYKSEEVEKDKLFKILEAGRWSPSSGNVQNWRFVVVTDSSVKMKLAEACLGQYWLTSVPVIIVVLSDDSKLRMLFGKRGEHLYSIQNCSVAMQNMMLEAESLDLATSWVGAYDDDKVLRILRVEEPSVSVRGLLALGYPASTPPPPRRMDLDKIVHFNKWGNNIFK